MLKSESGYTVIELLVVAVIIGVLTSFAIAYLSNQNQRATLAIVKADIKNLSTALESYQTENAIYPAGLNGLTPEFMVNIPIQPAGNGSFRYCLGASGAIFELDTDENEYGPPGETTEIYVVSGSGVQEGDGTADSC